MPMREHRAEQTPVGRYKSFRRMPIKSNRAAPPGGRGGPFPTNGRHAIIGFPPGGEGSEIQEMRAEADTWDVLTFGDWLDNNGFESSIIPATEGGKGGGDEDD